MKARLHITVDATLLDKAKAYAAVNKMGLSSLVENYLRSIIENHRKESLLDIIDRLPASANDFPGGFDFKKAYYEDRKKSTDLDLLTCLPDNEFY